MSRSRWRIWGPGLRCVCWLRRLGGMASIAPLVPGVATLVAARVAPRVAIVAARMTPRVAIVAARVTFT